MLQYLDLCRRIINEGEWVSNVRTGKSCLTLINHDLTYHVDRGEFPLVTTRKSYWKPALMEMLGYLRGYSSAAQFRAIGCNTWNANANDNKAWLRNPNRSGVDDIGRAYGVQAREWTNSKGEVFDQLRKVYNNLKQGIDDRFEIINFYNPGEIEEGCLRPCMYSHHFSLVNGTLHLNSTQRSCDVMLGLNFNMVQCYFLLAVMAKITGNKPGKVYHKIVNAHIYEDQVDLVKNVQLMRTPYGIPSFHISDKIDNLDYLLNEATVDDFTVSGYEHHEPIKYPFSV